MKRCQRDADRYEGVRNAIISHISESRTYDYSEFNRHWNDRMRREFALPENYIDVYEFGDLCRMAVDKQVFRLGTLRRLMAPCCPLRFSAWCDRAPGILETAYTCNGSPSCFATVHAAEENVLRRELSPASVRWDILPTRA